MSANHDFDFLFGRWRVANEKLRARLVGSTDWDRFEGTQECRPILGGLGNLDEMVLDGDSGFIGVSLRLFEPAAQRWTIYWVANQTGLLEPPVHGTFTDGTGTFLGRDTHAGTPVLVRYRWLTAPPHPRWDQSFSTDEGATWETNWIMTFTRL